jgi:two-component system sensor histidine kinase/response regulator
MVKAMATALSQPTVLVVEDEPGTLEIITFLLEEEKLRVLQAHDGEAALSLLEKVQPDLVISDVRMSGMDGFTLCKHVRANPTLSHVPFIFLTGKGDRADVRRGMRLGADDYLTKPFEPEELLSAVQVRLTRAAEAKAAINRASADLQDAIIRALTHEFRTPLSLIVGYTDLMEASGQEMSDEDFQRVLQGLHEGSRRLMSLVEDFLLLSRLRTGSVARSLAQEPPSPLRPDQVVRSVAAQAQARAADRNVSLVVDCTTPDLNVAISNGHLCEIVRRLVDNAIKFSNSDGGQVGLTTRQEMGYWVLSVTDDGVGIRQEALSSIFEAFNQVDRAQMEQQGTGVGLTIVRGLVEAHRGRIGVESTPGSGSVFSVWLPLASD